MAAEPISLEHALELAMRNNPDARIALQRIQSARAGIEQADAALWPKLQLQTSYARTDNPMQVFGSILNQRSYSERLDFNDVPDMDNLNAKVLATMPLYAGGGIRASRQAARAGVSAAKFDEQAVRNALGFEVVRAYFSVLKAGEFIQTAEAAVKAFESNVGLARKRQELGAVLRTDVLDLEVRLAQAREDAVRARNAQAIAQHALRNLVASDQELSIDPRAVLQVPRGASAAVMRAELQAAAERERMAEAKVRAMKSGYLPSISAFGSVDSDYGWRNDKAGQSYMAGVLAQWDLWDGKMTRSKVSEAQAGLAVFREESRKVRLAINLETETARLQLQTAEERLQVSRHVIEQAEQSVALTRSRYEQGAALSAQLIDAETALVAARVRRAEAEADRSIAIAALRKSLGLPQIDAHYQNSKP